MRDVALIHFASLALAGEDPRMGECADSCSQAMAPASQQNEKIKRILPPAVFQGGVPDILLMSLSGAEQDG